MLCGLQRKVTIAAIGLNTTNWQESQMVGVMTVLTASTAAQAYVNPYRAQSNNDRELLTLVIGSLVSPHPACRVPASPASHPRACAGHR